MRDNYTLRIMQANTQRKRETHKILLEEGKADVIAIQEPCKSAVDNRPPTHPGYYVVTPNREEYKVATYIYKSILVLE